MFFLYQLFIIPLLQLAAWILSRMGKGKIGDAARGQTQAIQKLKEGLEKKPPQGPVVWFHVSSAGEFLQAKPVIELLKKQQPEIYIAVSFFSPSGMVWASKFPQADFVGYCPIDSRKQVRQWLELLKPRCMVTVKFDIWPNMVTESKKFGASTFLISATLTKKSRRQSSAWRRSFFSQIYAAIEHIYCVSEEDQRLFRLTNPEHPDIKVYGDTRVDSVLDRQGKAAQTALNPHLKALREAHSFILVGGSSWEDDEELLLPAWQKLKKDHADALLVLAPHEPNPKHLLMTENFCTPLGLKSLTYSQFLQGPPGKVSADLLIVDQVGVLADLYRIGNAAFVGSGAGGVHNTMEPAAWGLPVTFRPFYHNSPEAIAMLSKGIFEVVTDSHACHNLLEKWLVNFQNAKDIGKKGREFFEKSQGATYKCAQSILMEIR